MKLRDIMTKDVSVTSKEDTVQEAANKMRELNVGAIPIVQEDGKPVGMITDRDIVLRNVSQGQISSTVGGIMTGDLIYGHPDMDINEAAALMAQNQIRRLPVIKNDKLIGIVSIGDLATRPELADEAGQALSQISFPANQQL